MYKKIRINAALFKNVNKKRTHYFVKLQKCIRIIDTLQEASSLKKSS